MSDTTKVKVIELEANKLVKGAKYIFVLNEGIVTREVSNLIVDELEELLGTGNFVFLELPPNSLKIYSIEPEETIENVPAEVQ